MGAPQSRLYETALGLQKRGWAVSVITAMPNYPKGKIFQEYRGRFQKSEIIDGIYLKRYWLYASNSRKSIPRIFSMITFSLSVLFSIPYLLKFRPNYILVESPPLLLGLSGLFLSKISRSKMIFNVSDIWPLSAVELGVINKKSVLYRFLEKLENFIYNNSFACTGQSDEIVEHIQQRKKNNVWLYRNGVNVQRFLPVKEKIFNSRIRIVYTGLLGVAQGILDISRNLIFKEGEIEFHIYGDGPEKNEIVDYLKKNPNRGIYYNGTVERSKIPEILVNYDITLIPLKKNIYGAVPSKIYEAMAAGLPILFTGGGEGARIIERYDLGWVCDPLNYSQIQLTLNEITVLPKEVLDKKRRNCLKTANDIFNREIQIDNLNKLLVNFIES